MHYGYYYGCLFQWWWRWVLVNLLKMVKAMKIKPVNFMWGGMDLKVYPCPDDLSIYSVTNQCNEIFLEMLSEYYAEKLQDDFIKFMAKKALDYETENRVSNLSIDELTEHKQGLGIL